MNMKKTIKVFLKGIENKISGEMCFFDERLNMYYKYVNMSVSVVSL